MAIDYSVFPNYGGRGEPKRKRKGREKRTEAKVKKSVRAQCVERDGYCRCADRVSCDGPSEWAHLEDKKRARTRGQAPTVRHTTSKSMMLCRRHHRLYDEGKLLIRFGTDKGADGPLWLFHTEVLA